MDIKQLRELATAARLQAAAETLTERRRQYEQSAERWEVMIQQAEDNAGRKVINDADKLARPYHQR